MLRFLTRAVETFAGTTPPPPAPAPRPPRPAPDPPLTAEMVKDALRTGLRLQQVLVGLAEPNAPPGRGDAYAAALKIEEELRALEVFRRRLVEHGTGNR